MCLTLFIVMNLTLLEDIIMFVKSVGLYLKTVKSACYKKLVKKSLSKLSQFSELPPIKNQCTANIYQY